MMKFKFFCTVDYIYHSDDRNYDDFIYGNRATTAHPVGRIGNFADLGLCNLRHGHQHRS